MDEDWYSYDRHTAAIGALLEELDLRDATFVLHDWGGPIGLRLAVEQPERVARLVLMDTGIFTGEQAMSEAWHRFADFVDRVDELPVGLVVRRGCVDRPGRRGRRRLRRAVPERGEQGRRARVPGAGPAQPADPGARRGRACSTRCSGDTPRRCCCCGAPRTARCRRATGEALRGRAGPPGAAADRGRRPFPPGGPRRARSARLIADWLGLTPRPRPGRLRIVSRTGFRVFERLVGGGGRAARAS